MLGVRFKRFGYSRFFSAASGFVSGVYFNE